MNMRKGLGLLATLVLGASGAASAQACDCNGYGYGFGFPYGVYSTERIPHFALHPPVYYSYPVARPYGYSPWAYPPSVMTPETESVEPKTMSNPFVPRPKLDVPASDRVTGGPLRIRNRFVEVAGGDALEEAPQGMPQPKVIHPALVAR